MQQTDHGHKAIAQRAPTPASTALGLVYGIAFLSGAAALIYELTWAKMLALTFGSTTLSAAAVIAGFMGGMGLGARNYPLLGRRVARPLVAYAGLEFAIAASTTALTMTFYSLPDVFGVLARSLDSAFLLAFLRFLSVIGLLIIPAGLMGATFPALCRVMIDSAPAVDRRLGWIYGVNTMGGAVGVALGALFLVDRYGLSTTVHVANGMNVTAGIVALLLLRGALGTRAAVKPVETETAIPTALPQLLTGTVLAVSGFTTLAYEIMWFRALRLLVGSSTYALGMILLIFLAGLGLGALLLRPIVRRAGAERSLGLVQCAIAVLALWAMTCPALVLSHDSIHPHVSMFLPQVRFQPWIARLAIVAFVGVVTMLPATILMGLSFPIASRMFIGDVRKLEANIGEAYWLANCGSILGAIVAAALLLPQLGVVGGTKLCAIANLLLGLVVLAWLGKTQRWVVGAALCAVVAGVLFVMLPPRLGLYGEPTPGRLVFYGESDMGTVQVIQTTDDPQSRVMLVDGTRIGCGKGLSTSAMYFKQILLAHLPLGLDPDPRRTLNVGLGSGSTLEALAAYPDIEALDCVEINPAVVRGSGAFSEVAVLDDPRAHLVVDDAVHFLLRTTTPYDLIISDGKQDPFHSGNASLLCREYYQYARDALDNDGLFVQWIHLKTLHEDFLVILRSISDVFEHVEVFAEPPDTLVLVASKEPILNRVPVTQAGSPPPEAFALLEPFGIADVNALLGRWVAGKPQFGESLRDQRPSTWDHLRLDYSAFRADLDAWVRANEENLRFLRKAGEQHRRGLPPAFDPQKNRYIASSRLVRRAFEYLFAQDAREALRTAREAVELNPADVKAVQIRNLATRVRNAQQASDRASEQTGLKRLGSTEGY